MRLPRPGRAGFTLVEMMVALTLAGVAGMVIYSVFLSTRNAYYDTQELTQSVGDVRVGLALLAQDVRSAGSDARGIGVARFVQCDAESLRTQSDLDGDGVVEVAAQPAEDVVWFWSGAARTLFRRTADGDLPILRGVTSFTVTYLDAAGAAVAPLPLDAAGRARVRAVEVRLDIDAADGVTREYSRVITLRNDTEGI